MIHDVLGAGWFIGLIIVAYVMVLANRVCGDAIN
jgi:hypothetical protein